ncbi:MAG: DUF4390 domain-containing protein [Spirochaetaceae bacterium]
MIGHGARYIRAAIRRVVRISAPGAIIPYVFLLLLISAVSIPLLSTRSESRAELEVDAFIIRDDLTLQLNATAQPVARDEIVDTLEEGLRARITMHARLFDDGEDRFSLLGRSVVEEMAVERTISFDPYRRGYRIVDSRSVETTMSDLDAAIDEFFRVDGVLVTVAADAVSMESEVRMVLEPRVIPDALYLVRAISGHGTIVSAWVTAGSPQ